MPLTIHNHVVDKLAIIVGVTSGISLYPQVWKILTAQATGISVLTYVIIFMNSVVWLAYAFHRRLFSLMIASTLNLFASSTVIIWFFFF